MSQLTPDDVTALRILAQLGSIGKAAELLGASWSVILPSGAELDADEATALMSFYANDGIVLDEPCPADVANRLLERSLTLQMQNATLRMDNATLRAECDAQAETIKYLRRVMTRRWWHRFRRARPDAS